MRKIIIKDLYTSGQLDFLRRMYVTIGETEHAMEIVAPVCDKERLETSANLGEEVFKQVFPCYRLPADRKAESGAIVREAAQYLKNAISRLIELGADEGDYFRMSAALRELDKNRNQI